jgi:hypothetical protein
LKKQKKALPPKKAGIESRFVDLMDLDNPTIITLYGKPGTGKTTIASSLPTPILLIDVKDKGTDSAKSKQLKRGDIKVLAINNFDDIYDAYDYLKDNPTKFKSVVIDHMTSLQDQALEKVKEDEGKDQVSQRMYGIAAGYMKEVIVLYKDLTDLGILPCFLVQDRMESGEGEGEDQLTPEVGPGLMPSLSRTLCASSRIIGHTYLQERVEKTGDLKVHRSIEYRLRLGPNPYYITKVTRPQQTPCPPFVVNATYADIVKIIKGEWKEPEAPSKKKKKSSRKK